MSIQSPANEQLLVTEADLDRYLRERHSVGYAFDMRRDGLSLALIRAVLRVTGDLFGLPHRAFLRWSIRRLMRTDRRAGRVTSGSDAYLREIIAIDVWTLSWPVFHVLVLYAAMYALTGQQPGPARTVAIAVVAALSAFRVIDISLVLLRLHVAERYVPHLSSRAMVGTFLQLIDITTAFAIGYMLLRVSLGTSAFGGEDLLGSAVRPWYYSFVTITTLGYGDISARDWRAQLLVIAELFVGLSVVAVILQHVLSPERKRSDAAAPQDAIRRHDSVYAAFIDRFRHPEQYLRDIFRRFVPVLRNRGVIVDIGCGRGEFLEVMREAGIAAYGVETNREFVRRCEAKGLQVLETDWDTHLRSVADHSLGGVVAAQVIEHMTPEQILDFLALAAAKIEAGGILIIETLTPCLNTLLRKFWVDITHRSPIHPEALTFLAGAFGFRDVSVEYYNETEKPLQCGKLAGTSEDDLARVNALLFQPHYYAVIGTRG